MPATTYAVGDRTREEILRAARRLFLERGYSQVSVSDIASAAGCAKGSVHYHFGPKVKVLAALVEPVCADYTELREKVDAAVEAAKQSVAISGWVDLLIRHRETYLILHAELAELLRQSAMRPLLMSGAFIPEALVQWRTDPAARAAAMFAIHGATGVLRDNRELPEEALRPYLTDSMSAVLQRFS